MQYRPSLLWLTIALLGCGDDPISSGPDTVPDMTDTLVGEVLVDSAVPDVADDIALDTLADTAPPDTAVEVDVGPPRPSEAELAAVHQALDVFLDMRMEAPAGATAVLVAQIGTAHMTLADVEALLRKGRASYPTPPPQRPGLYGTYVDDATKPDGFDYVPAFESGEVTCYSYDYTTRYYIYVPTDYTPERAWPLVYVGHGGNSAMSAERARIIAEMYLDSYFDAQGEQMGAIVVAPATERGWGAVGNSIIFSTISKVSRDYHVDAERTYITGQSMGGHMSWRTALTFSDRFGAVSPQSGGYDTWATTNALANVYNIPGYTTYGKEEPYGLNATNNLLAAWLHDHNYPWITMEKDGGHEIYQDELPLIADFFMAHPRDLYRRTVYFRGGGAMKHGDETNAAWTPTIQVVDPDRPIRWNLRHWIEITPRPDITEQLVYFAENKGDNRIEITAQNVRQMRVMVHPRMVDMTRPVTIAVNGQVRFEGVIAEDLGFMLDLAREFDDRGRIFHGYADLTIEDDVTVADPVYP